MKRQFKTSIVLAMAFVLCGVQAFAQSVIMLIPDGMSISGTTLARFYKGEPLALDAIACGLVSTWSSDGTIADSAPAGSAYSTGWTSQTGNIGRSTGIISTSEFMHATPADFASHDVSRSNYDNLAEQIVYNGLDVVLGGGTPFLSAANP